MCASILSTRVHVGACVWVARVCGCLCVCVRVYVPVTRVHVSHVSPVSARSPRTTSHLSRQSAEAETSKRDLLRREIDLLPTKKARTRCDLLRARFVTFPRTSRFGLPLNETYYSVKRDLPQCQKRPTTVHTRFGQPLVIACEAICRPLMPRYCVFLSFF